MGLSAKAISYRLDEEEVDTPSTAIITRAPELLKSIFKYPISDRNHSRIKASFGREI